MSRKVAEEMVPRLRQRYAGRGREGRSRLIDEVCEQWGYSRKHAIKLLGARSRWGGDPAVPKGRPPEHGGDAIEVLWRIRKVAEQPCGKRLKALLPTRLPHYEGEHGRLKTALRKKVLAVSAAQTDRLLAPRKTRAGHRGRSGTKPGGLLKTQIPIRTENWDITRPGFLEADTVAHCGGILEATRDAEGSLPFELPGCDRLEHPQLVDLVNALYRDCWEPLHNYFLPSAKAGEQMSRGSQGQTPPRPAPDALRAATRQPGWGRCDQTLAQVVTRFAQPLRTPPPPRGGPARPMQPQPPQPRCPAFRVNDPTLPDHLRGHSLLSQRVGALRCPR